MTTEPREGHHGREAAKRRAIPAWFAVGLCAGCVKPKAVPVERFRSSSIRADESSLRRATAAMISLGMTPETETGSAFGVWSPVTTAWRTDGNYRLRWLVHVKGSRLLVESICFVEVEQLVQGKEYASVVNQVVPCGEQPVGLSAVAAAIAARVGEAGSSAPSATPDPSVDP
jgi:hypothetical protein